MRIEAFKTDKRSLEKLGQQWLDLAERKYHQEIADEGKYSSTLFGDVESFKSHQGGKLEKYKNEFTLEQIGKFVLLEYHLFKLGRAEYTNWEKEDLATILIYLHSAYIYLTCYSREEQDPIKAALNMTHLTQRRKVRDLLETEYQEYHDFIAFDKVMPVAT